MPAASVQIRHHRQKGFAKKEVSCVLGSQTDPETNATVHGAGMLKTVGLRWTEEVTRSIGSRTQTRRSSRRLPRKELPTTRTFVLVMVVVEVLLLLLLLLLPMLLPRPLLKMAVNRN
uniref:Uncharacterized protein n=1 Tax=Anopheles farauti TaxID=69004 RepID=A0A182R140_9DIPT